MELRLASVDDARGIAELHVRSWKQAYRDLLPEDYLDSLPIDQRENLWVEALLCGHSKVLLAVEADEITGFLNYGASRDKDADAETVEILAMYVEPTRWRKGIGRALWRECCLQLHAEGYQAVIVWIVTGNTRGISFYEAMGFEREDGMIEPFELAGVTLLEQRYKINLG